MIGDKSYYWHILLSNTTRLHCKQWQLRISPESISLTLQPVIVSSLNFLVLLHIYKKAKLYFRIVHSQRDHFNCKKKKKKRAVMEIQYIFLTLPESWYRKVEESASPIIFLSINLWQYECQVPVTQ